MQSKCFKSFILLVLLNVSALSAFATGKSLSAVSQLFTLPVEQICELWDSNDLCPSVRHTSEPTFSVYGGKDGKGFAIVSGERILGYSADGVISSPGGLPEPMCDYLMQLDEELRSLNVQQAAKVPGNVVVELETAKWAQRDPYNRMCPIKNGSRCLTGCIPTAFAIVMKHHKWPVHGTGKVYNPITGESVDISSHTYNWDEMQMEYSSGNYIEAQANEVAALMMHLGFAYMVEYSPSNTGGNHNSSTLAKKFGYVDVGKTQRWQVGDAEWVRLIKESLDNGCPVPYAATNSGSGSGDAKHIFVLDGYTDNGYYHFNWGWGGNGNGYFLLTAMKPFDGDNYSKADSHQAYFNLRPDRVLENYTVSVSATEGGTATVNDAQSVTVQEGSKITLVAVPDEGYEFAGWLLNDKVVSNETTYTTTATASVEYIATFGKKAEAKKYTVSVNKSNYGKVYIGKEGVTSVEAEKGSKLTLYAMAYDGYNFLNWTLDGVVISTAIATTITVEASAQYVANFEKIETGKKYTIELYSAGKGGKVYIDDDKECTRKQVEQGTIVEIHAVADKGYEVDYWAIDDGGLEFPLQGAGKDAVINVLSNFTFYAYFKVSTSVDCIEEGEYTVAVQEKGLQVSGYCGALRIYRTDGTKVQDCIVENSLTVELPKGVYIVSFGKKNLIVNIK